MGAKYVTKAIMLWGRPYGEADRILTAFTKERGRVDFLARGVRKMQAKNRALVQPLTYSEIELAEGKGLDVLTQGVLIEGFMRIHQDFDRMIYAGFLGEFLMQVLPLQEPYVELCYQFLQALNHLDKRETDPRVVAVSFLMKSLTLLGYQPDLTGCQECGSPLDSRDGYRYSFSQGGLICPDCPGESGDFRMTLPALAALGEMENLDLRRPVEISWAEADLCLLETFMTRLLESIMETEHRSARFLSRFREMRRPEC